MPLPTSPIVNALSPERLRALLYGAPGAGKTTLASQWYPASTLIVDLEGGTRFLSGEHFVERPANYSAFMGLVNELVTTQHQFTTVVIDSIDHLVRMADAEAGQRHGKIAAGLVEFGKGLADRDGVVMRDLGRLLATDLGLILCAHPVKVTVTDDAGVESNGCSRASSPATGTPAAADPRSRRLRARRPQGDRRDTVAHHGRASRLRDQAPRGPAGHAAGRPPATCTTQWPQASRTSTRRQSTHEQHRPGLGRHHGRLGLRG